jgi:hypothetical protein
MGVLGQGTVIVDGQRTTAPPMAAFVPPSYGIQTTGVPNVSPIVPPYASGTTGGVQGSAGAVAFNSVNGYGTADNNAAQAAQAAANPHSLRVSPVWWAVGALVGGVLLLQAVSWRDTIEEHAHVGPAHESASAGV